MTPIPHPMGMWARCRIPVTVLAIAIVLACLFAISLTLALGRPALHGLPIALVGPRGAAASLPTVLEAATGHGIAFHPCRSVEVAGQEIANQDVYAALIPQRGATRLLIASTAGPSVADALQEIVQRLPAALSRSVSVEDVRPLPPGNSAGLVLFYVMIAKEPYGQARKGHATRGDPPPGRRVQSGERARWAV